MSQPDVIIAGAGLAGLTCALELKRRGLSVALFEASDAVGGRVRTDEHDGFLLDRGFQVLLTAYPTARHYLDYAALDLKPFYPGAMIRTERGFQRVSDPARVPHRLLETALGFVGTLPDRVQLLRMTNRLMRTSLDAIWRGDETSTLEYLVREGFSDRFLLEFFMPFYGGVMLDPSLEVSSKVFEFTFKMFAEGTAAVPALGMQQLPAQLAAKIGHEHIHLNTPVAGLSERGLILASGDEVTADRVVIATDAAWASEAIPGMPRFQWNSVTTLYYSADRAPTREPILVLDATRKGPVNNLVTMSKVSPEYAPPGKELISATILGLPNLSDAELDGMARDHIGPWFGPDVADWELLRAYRIPHAQPHQPAGALHEAFKQPQLTERLYLCGDFMEVASIQGAMNSGARTAQIIAQS